MTIQEIAEMCGVSASTVSRVFSRQPGIREEIRKKVLETSRKYGYHPRVSAREKNVLVVTPYDSIFPVQSCVHMILMALAQSLPRHGFRMEILPVNSLERLDRIQFCCAVAIGCELSDFSGWADRFPVPLILMDRQAPEKTPDSVCFIHSDEAQGMSLAVHCLASSGCRKIGCIIHGTPDRGNAGVRMQATLRALEENRLPSDSSLMHYSGDGTEKYVELIGRLLKKGVDGLFCPGGNAGILSLYALSLFNRRVPDEISLISSEQTAFSSFTVPPLTTISPDYPALAESVCKVLEDWLENTPLPRSVCLPYHLIERESCRAAGGTCEH